MYHSFLIHSFTDGHFGSFQHLSIVNNAAVNIGCIDAFELVFQDSEGIVPAMETLDQKAVQFLNVLGSSILFSTVAAPGCIPTKSSLGSLFSPSSLTLVCCVGYDGHSEWCEVVSHCGFYLHLSDG